MPDLNQKLIDAKYQKALREIRPQFGNDNQIEALKLVQEVEGAERLVADKLKNQTAIKKAEQTLYRLKNHVIFLLQKNN